jgi:hypothetical protein
LVSVAGVRGIEERVGIFYVDGLGDGGDGEDDGNFLRQLGADLDQRIVGRESGVLQGQMVGAQRQLLGRVFAVGSSVEAEFEVACLADEKAVGGQDGAVGIGDGEAEFTGAILGAGEQGDKQEKKCGVDQDTAQMDSPRSAGSLGDILQRSQATAVGRERYYLRAGEAAVLAARGASTVRIRACLQACRSCCVVRAPSGAEAGD